MEPKHILNNEDIERLRELLKDTEAQIVTPNEKEAYTASIRRWSRAAEKPAGACLIPKSAGEISIALKYASEHKLDIAIKGGGHSTAGASSTDGGLLIDLNTHMRSTDVDAENKTIRVGGGATWGEVDNALAPYGLAAVGGTVTDTGVGGLTFGGGFGWLTTKFGLVIDNLISCTVVLADGSIVTASNDDHQDLFWALRGAGQNFGVGVEFVFQAHETGDLWAGLMLFPPLPETIHKIVEAFNAIFTPDANGVTKAVDKASGGFGLIRPSPAGGQVMFFVVFTYHGPEEDGKKLLQDVLAQQPVMNTISMMPYVKANKLLDLPIGARASLKGSAYELPVKSEFVLSVVDAYSKFTEENPDAAGSQIMWEFLDPTRTVAVKNSDMAFANRGRHFNSAVVPIWRDEKNDTKCRQWSRDVALMFKQELQRQGAETGESNDGWIGKRGKHGATMVYGNYDQYEERSKDVFGDNYERLQELKANYDPNNMFNKLFAVEPKSGAP